MISSQRLYWMHSLIEGAIADRIKEVKDNGKVCSLFQAMTDAQVIAWKDAFRTLVEAIEDAESL